MQHFFNILISSDFAHIPNLSFSMDVVSNGENRFALFIIVFVKIGVIFWVRIGQNFKLYAAVAVYSPRSSSLALISLVFMFTSYFLSGTFNLSNNS